MRNPVKWWREMARAVERARQARDNDEVFIYMGVPKEDIRNLDLEDLIRLSGESVAVLVGRMTPEEFEAREQQIAELEEEMKE